MMARALRVMQSFRAPRSTTNPYIVMLDRALSTEEGIEHRTFSWRGALTSRVDVLHLHWPEILLEGDRPWKRVGKRMLFRMLLLKLAVSRAAVVRTAHNVELPTDVDAATRRLLEALERAAVHRVTLNPLTQVPWSSPATVIPHGHYRDWFASYPRQDPVPGRIGYFGLIRRYKGVETLLAAYAHASSDSQLSLRIGGKPSSAELAEAITTTLSALPRASATLRFLTDAELVEIATSSQLIVLPYRFMHNSGGALAALSLGRPVLVPRNGVNTALAEEVGPRWVHQFDGDLTPADLAAAIAATAGIQGEPDLSAREWEHAGRRHAQVYDAAVRDRRGRA